MTFRAKIRNTYAIFQIGTVVVLEHGFEGTARVGSIVDIPTARGTQRALVEQVDLLDPGGYLCLTVPVDYDEIEVGGEVRGVEDPKQLD